VLKIISDKEIRHHSDCQGVVISRQQIVVVDGKKFRCDFWTVWETGKLHHVDSNQLD
jgi:hypothetical protein